MKQQNIIKWFGLISLIFSVGCCGLGVIILVFSTGCYLSQCWLRPAEWVLSGIFTVEHGLTDAMPEEVFKKYVQDYRSELNFNDEITQLEGLEGAIAYGVQGPAFVRFEATDAFINELLQRESSFGLYGRPAKYNLYVSMNCTFFQEPSIHALMRQFPERFEWWEASNVSSPICYQSLGEHYNDGGKYLLIDPKNNTVYFYNSEICQICQD